MNNRIPFSQIKKNAHQGVAVRYLRRVKYENARLPLSLKTSYYDVFTSLCSARSPSNPLLANKKERPGRRSFYLAERRGFEPLVR